MPPRFQLPKFSGENKLRFGLALLVIVLVSAALLRFVEWAKPKEQYPLLTDATGIVRLTEPSEVSNYTDTLITKPTELFGATLHVIGVYPQPNEAFPEKTVALVYVRDQNRFVEIDYRSQTTTERELAGYAEQKKETITLTDTVDATLVQLRNQSFCKSSSEHIIGVCQFTRMLTFEQDGIVITIFVDGRHLTDGELIQMAKSIVDASTSE